jgi:hypothetical protein
MEVKEPPKIRVVVRKRPLTQKEGMQPSIIEIYDAQNMALKEMK